MKLPRTHGKLVVSFSPGFNRVISCLLMGEPFQRFSDSFEQVTVETVFGIGWPTDHPVETG